MRKREKNILTVMLAIRMCICSRLLPTSLVLDLTSQISSTYLPHPAITHFSATLLIYPTAGCFGQGL